MKYLFLLCALLCSLISLAQPAEPMKGDNVIEISTSLPDSALYRIVGRTLLQSGYTFKADREFNTFKTDERPLPKWQTYMLTNNLSIQTGKIMLTGLLRPTVNMNFGGSTIVSSPFALEYRKSGTTMHRPGFLQMIELATNIQQAIQGSVLAFKRK